MYMAGPLWPRGFNMDCEKGKGPEPIRGKPVPCYKYVGRLQTETLRTGPIQIH